MKTSILANIKLLFASVLTFCFFIILFTYSNYVININKNEWINNSYYFVNSIEKSCIASLMSNNIVDLNEKLENLHENLKFKFCVIYNQRGEISGSIPANAKSIIQNNIVKQDSIIFDKSTINIIHPIVYNKKHIATLNIGIQNESLANLYKLIYIMLTLMVIISIIFLYFIYNQKVKIIDPINNLENLTLEISQNKDYTKRALESSGFRVENLYKTFNGLLEQIAIQQYAKSQAEDAVLESEIRYRSLFQLSPIPILVYSRDKILFLNLSAIETLAGKFAKDFIGQPIKNIIHPESYNTFENVDGKEKNFELKLLKHNNQHIFVEAKKNYIEYKGVPAYQIIFQDISERKKTEKEMLLINQKLEQRVKERTIELYATNDKLENEINKKNKIEKELRESEERFRALFNSTQDCIAVWNNKKEFIFANNAFIEHIQYDNFVIKGLNISKVLSHLPEMEKLFSERISQIFNKPVTFKIEDKIKIIDSILTIESIYSPIFNVSDNVILACVVYRDITERTLNNEKIKNYASELETANAELEAFTYSISHDLRAPLRSIDGFTKILLEDESDNLSVEGKRHLEIVKENSKYMRDLINDLLNFSRLSRKPLEKQSVNIQNVINEILYILKPEYNEKSIEFKIDKNLDINIKADALLLKQVFINLLENAIKYSSKTENPIISIGVENNNKNNIYFVKDNGIGFDMQYADKLFKVFNRLHRVDEFTGTGVGLAIVKKIITRHGGDIWVKAKENSGAAFYFTLAPV